MEIKSTLKELFPETKHIARLVLGIEAAVADSMERQKMRTITVREVKARFERCVKWAEILRGDLGWGVERIANSLPYMLDAELSGQTWEPSKRLCWVKTDGA